MAKKKSGADDSADDDSAPGWDAISRACDRLYPGREPQHWGTIVRWSWGGKDPLDGISAYRAPGPPVHWHFVSYGLTELYQKTSDNREESGWGFELTFRLRRKARDAAPPTWAMNFLQNLARYVFETENVFGPGHHMDLNGPIALERPDTQIRAVAFAEDPELRAIETPHGHVQFLQVIGLTPDEYDAARQWDTDKLLALVRRRDRLLVTDLDRPSYLDDPATAAAVARGLRRDGSSQSGAAVDVLTWTVDRRKKPLTAALTLGAFAVERFKQMLTGRLPYDRPCWLWGPEGRQVEFRPASRTRWEEASDGPVVHLAPAAVDAIVAGLEPKRGQYQWPELPGLTIIVRPTEIRDKDDRVIEVVG
jgi:hypothetical protein